MIENSLDAMLAAGFTRRMATHYLKALEWENSCGLFDADTLEYAHSRGFCAESFSGYDLNAHGLDEYLSDYEYARLWPLNSWQRIWINDKLTLKYMLAGTEQGRYLPEYYYYTQGKTIVPLVDSTMDPSFEGFLDLLGKKGSFACKPCNGEGSSGFHKLEGSGASYAIDGADATSNDIAEFIAAHPNYVFTEFIRPEASLAKISPHIHTLRVLVINPDGASPVVVGNYLRFGVAAGTEGTFANYRAPVEADMCSLNCTVDFDSGHFGQAMLVYANRTVDAPVHPDSGAVTQGTMPCWDQTLEMIQSVSMRLGPLNYLGFDIGITDDGPKIMEINSHSGPAYVQLFTPLLAHEAAGPFFQGRIDALDSLNEHDIELRNAIRR